MKIRKALVTCLAAACLSLVGLAGGVLPASAENHTYTVTLVNGATMPLTLDVPPGTQLQDIALPANLADYIVSISDGTQTVLAADLKRSPAQQDENSDQPKAGTGADISKPKSQANSSASGTGNTLQPSADSLKKERKSADDGTPDPNNPTYSFALPGPAPI